jgi:hypothetical protein
MTTSTSLKPPPSIAAQNSKRKDNDINIHQRGIEPPSDGGTDTVSYSTTYILGAD